jgi:hypothetical protein
VGREGRCIRRVVGVEGQKSLYRYAEGAQLIAVYRSVHRRVCVAYRYIEGCAYSFIGVYRSEGCIEGCA